MFHLSRRLGLAGLILLLAVRSALAADPFTLPKPAESFDAGTLHIDQFGSGKKAVILIPGLAGGAWVWSDTIARLAPDHTVYVITLPGFDGRPATEKKPLFTTFASDFWKLLADHKIEKPVVIGHSLGGTLAIALAEEHPEQLAGIVAVDGLPIFPMLANATPEQQKAMAEQMAAMFTGLTGDQLLENQKGFLAAIGTIKPELVDPAARLNARSDPKAIAAWMQEDLTTDLRPSLSKITIPFLEIMPYNAPDAKPPMAYTKEQTLDFYKSLVAGAPKMSVVPIEPSRHFVMLDQPEALYKELAKFLATISR